MKYSEFILMRRQKYNLMIWHDIIVLNYTVYTHNILYKMYKYNYESTFYYAIK